MRSPFGMGRRQARTNHDAVELALDLTADAVVLHERSSHDGWKKFASAQLDDPEFTIVIGLLQSDAEAHAGQRRPVRLWLLGAQVLKQTIRIAEGSPAERLQAAFEYIRRETVYRPEDVAIAVAPGNRNGETTLLITFAETWREARNHAAHWGFMPGDVSTRHQAMDFGTDGPAFHLNTPEPQPAVPVKRRRMATIALATAAAGIAVWSFQSGQKPPARSDMAPGTAVAISAAETPPATQSLVDEPTPATEPKTRAETLLNAGIPNNPTAMLPDDAGRATIIAGSSTLEPRVALAALATMVVAPSPPPDTLPAPLAHDPIAAWTGPLPAPPSPTLLARLAAPEISRGMDPPVPVERIAGLGASGTPSQKPPAVPEAEPEPVTVAGTPRNVPIPVPRPARSNPDGSNPNTAEEPPLAEPLPPSPQTDSNEPEPEPAENTVATPAEPDNADAPTEFASQTTPLPKPRPARPVIPHELPSITEPSRRLIGAETIEGGLPLDRTTLIGILNLDTGHKALLRLPNGRYRTVIVGDVLNGWRVSMIGTDAMHLTRDNKDMTLLLVNR